MAAATHKYDVFLSYGRRDQDIAQRVLEGLKAEGLSVFWDHEIVPGEKWQHHIGAALEASASVVVLWSPASVSSEFVLDEANVGHKRGVLVPVMIEQTRPPLGFGQLHTIDLTNWDGSKDHHGWHILLEAVTARTPATRPARLPPPPPPIRRSRAYQPEVTPVAESAQETGSVIRIDPARTYTRIPGANGTRVFIAHASGDKPRIKPIIEVLARSGFQLWVDKPHLLGLDKKVAKRVKGIEFGGGDWKEQIRKGVHKASLVLAFWSDDAVDARREQFYYEVYMGLIQRKLCQCRIDAMAPSKIGMPYTFDQIADLSDYHSGAFHAELDFMMTGLPKFRKRVF